ncbi:pyrroline-5-carboxylate reductase [Lactobacillus sp. DCY120]|uniref:Pyrroline-5-carboxylate reductase n=1 Tax=Bombilactobacillus apium TaxID=2675299 RepID=A0A850R7J2_9LACO|nr:pyrroline-5-carboxylate reductase [Bombilactobacillus apium]NVY96642.1 pyrroline-5-carboxylate reductase [Bombilactobacillus apium]
MKIAFVGAGRIAQALMQGWLQAGVQPTDLLVKTTAHQSAQRVAQKYGLTLVENYSDFQAAQMVIIAVPTPALATIFSELAGQYSGIIVSVSGGDLATIAQEVAPAHFVKAIPNTPVQIDQGITALTFPKETPTAIQEQVTKSFNRLGQTYVVSEDLLGTYGTVAGCTPAFVAVMMDALSDVAVQNGIARDQAEEIINQMLVGTASLAQEKGQHPAQLKDQVATPGGSTIRGVVKLEETGFRNALIQAVNAANA